MSQSSQSNQPSGITPPSGVTCYAVHAGSANIIATIVAGYLLQALIIKALQIKSIAGSLSVVSLLQTWAPDLIFGAVTMVFFTLILSRVRRRARWSYGAIMTVFYIVMLAALVALVTSHGYFVSTGTNLSWSVVDYWLRNIGATSRVVASEISTWKLALIVIQPLWVIIATVIIKFGRVHRHFERIDYYSRKKSIIITSIMATVALSAAIIPAPSGRQMAAARCIPVAIVSEPLAELFTWNQTVEIAENERLDSALEFKKRPGAPTPNVVFIIFESLNWKSSDVYFPGKKTTPFLAKLAKEGLVLEHEYTTVPHTTKAIMSLLCGFYPQLSTAPKEATPQILPRKCLAHILNSQGYRSAFFQPAHNFEKRNQLIKNIGFHDYNEANDMPGDDFEDISYFGKEDKIMIQPSMRWIDKNSTKPFFLTYLTLATHHNYITPQSFPHIKFDTNDNNKQNFLNAARYVDSFIQELFSEFKKRDLFKNTIFVIVGDHGEGFGEHGRGQHDLVPWEEGLHTTALIYAPQYFPRPRKIQGIRSHLDWVPTVADILGLELKKGSFSGSSMLRPVPANRKLFFSCWFTNRCLAMREGFIKTIYHYGMQPMEVYDNRNDPFDTKNLAFQRKFDRSFLDARRTEMLRWRSVVNQQYDAWQQALGASSILDKEPPVQHKLMARFSDTIELVGYDANPPRVTAGQTVRLRYVFKCLKQPTSTQRLFVHVTQQRRFLNADHEPVNGTYPLHSWKPGQYIIDEHQVQIPGNWPTGRVNVAIGFWDKRDGKRFPITNTRAPIDQERLIVARIPVVNHKKRTSIDLEARRAKIAAWIGTEQPAFKKSVGAIFGDKIELVGVTLDNVNVALAGTAEMTYVFRALENIPEAWKLIVEFVRDDRFTIDGKHVPIGGLYPPSYWRKDEYVVDKHKVHIDLYKSKTGRYKLLLGFLAPSGPVRVSGNVPIDEHQMVYLGDVIISRPKIKMGR